MNRTELRKRALAAVPPFYRRTLGKFDTKIARILVEATLDTASSPHQYTRTVRVFLRPCASWKTKLSDQVKDQFTDQLEQKQKVAAQRSKKQGGTDGEVRL